MVIGNVQIGKQGITENFIISLANQFKNKECIKISVLKSARPEGKGGKAKVKEYAEEILKGLGPKYTAKTIGFVIALKKWRKPRTSK